MTTGTLRFPLEAVIPLIEHAQQAKQHMPMHSEPDPVKAGLIWFKDVGTGLMSSGLPRAGEDFVVWAQTEDGTELRDVVYRDNPETFDAVWDMTREICGGDDFMEKIALDDETNLVAATTLAKAQGFTWLTLEVDGESYTIGFEKSDSREICPACGAHDPMGDEDAWHKDDCPLVQRTTKGDE